ncbi:glycosyltransferase family 9 protein [Streptosporangium sp. NPDC087985]|uniref:glycosyltransferase family 9 protein n=1 Tax=Streptosporangium sp. NPDC087985 TaxID=3366196 RepID=UPI0037F7D563
MTSGGRTAGEAPVMMVLRGRGLGGLLAAVPALRALRRAHPDHRIVLAAPASLSDLVPLIGAVDELLDVPGPGPIPLGPRPDIAVNLYGGGPWSLGALRRTGPGLLLTHAHPGFPDVRGPSWRGGAHVVQRWCDLLGWYGIAADPADLGLKIPLSGRPAPIVVHPGAADRARRWPPERFALLAVALRQAGHEVAITGSAEERALAERVASLACLPEACVLAGRTGLRELAALVARARLVICGDTGVAHLATAFATPSVVLFGPVSPALRGPSHGPHVTLWAGRSGDPRGSSPDEGLLEIGVLEVLGAAVDLLELNVR